ncbi:MAG: hypothetical protein AB1568_10655 [Thermodesulfobacteriota bacterium]
MGYQEDLARLEGFVEKLLQQVDLLKQQKGDLEARLQQREAEILDLRNQQDSLKEERSEVHQRVSRIIGAIEEWEQQEDTAAVDKHAGKGQLVLGLGSD